MKIWNETHIHVGRQDFARLAGNGGVRQELPEATAALILHGDPDTRIERLQARARRVYDLAMAAGMEEAQIAGCCKLVMVCPADWSAALEELHSELAG